MTTRRRFVQLCTAAASVSLAPAAAPDPALARAMASARAAMPKAESDPERPVYHFHPPANWNNDPNGTIFYRGWHHLYYQFNPYGSLWGHMHWGHARSRDLVNWEHLPIALGPSEEKNEQHIFSGAAMIARDGKPRFFYTSIGKRQPEQWLAVPQDDDLITMAKYPGNPVLSQAAHGPVAVEDWRDPFLFQEAGATYMVCGGNSNGRRAGGGGVVHLYRAGNDELTEWKHLGVVFEHRDREVINVECPNLFRLDGRWVLIMSPHKPCQYFVGNLDLERVRFEPETRGVLDAGSSYASNISRDDQGRTILWLWGKTDLPEARGWNGVMVMPRILTVGPDGYLRQQPAPEFEKLRGQPITLKPADLTETPLVLNGVEGSALEIEAEFSGRRASSIGLELRRSADGKAGATVSISGAGMLSAGKAETLIGENDRHKLRIFLDKRAMEVYANDGQAAIFTNVDAGPRDLAIAAFARGGKARLESLRAWPMKAAEFNLDRYKL